MRTLTNAFYNATWAMLCTAAGLAVTFCAWFVAARAGAPAYGTIATLVGHLAAWSMVTGWERRSRTMTCVTVSSIAATFAAAEFYGVRAGLVDEPARLARFGAAVPGLIPTPNEVWAVLYWGFSEVPLHLIWLVLGLTLAAWRASLAPRHPAAAPLITSMR